MKLRFSPSGSARWFACPASIHYKAVEQSSIHIKMGLLAHTVVECLLIEVFKKGTVDINIAKKNVLKQIDKIKRDKEYLDDGYCIYSSEMFDNALLYLNEIEKITNGYTIVECEFEQEVVYYKHDNPSTSFNTRLDVYFLLKRDNELVLFVSDYKNGTYPVSIKNNPQLLIYSYSKRRKDLTKVINSIFQPRLRVGRKHKIKEFDVSHFYGEFHDTLTNKINACLVDTPEKNPSSTACKYCNGRDVCDKTYYAKYSIQEIVDRISIDEKVKQNFIADYKDI